MSKREKKAGKRKARSKEDWLLYLLRCKDGSLYTGITKNLDNRLKMHEKGKASKYTRARRPVELVYHEKCQSHTQALVRECKVKEYSKNKKEKLIVG